MDICCKQNFCFFWSRKIKAYLMMMKATLSACMDGFIHGAVDTMVDKTHAQIQKQIYYMATTGFILIRFKIVIESKPKASKHCLTTDWFIGHANAKVWGRFSLFLLTYAIIHANIVCNHAVYRLKKMFAQMLVSIHDVPVEFTFFDFFVENISPFWHFNLKCA